MNFRSFTAGVDFIIGLMLLFGGINLATHGRSVQETDERVIGMLAGLIGAALFVSAFRIARGRSSGVRVFAYVIAILAGAMLLAYQAIRKSPPVSGKDLAAWAAVTVVLICCAALSAHKSLGAGPS